MYDVCVCFFQKLFFFALNVNLPLVAFSTIIKSFKKSMLYSQEADVISYHSSVYILCWFVN